MSASEEAEPGGAETGFSLDISPWKQGGEERSPLSLTPALQPGRLPLPLLKNHPLRRTGKQQNKEREAAPFKFLRNDSNPEKMRRDS